SVAVTETVSGPSARPETFRPDATQAPEPSVTTVAVTAGLAPSPMLTWIVELGSADPEIPSAGALEESIVGMGSIVGVAGATVSFRPHRAPAAPVLPAASVAVADAVIAPSAKPVTFRPDTVQSPDPSATAEAVTKWSRPASDTSTDTVEFASAVPENETDPACEAVTAGNTATSGATGATVSLLPDALATAPVFPAASVAVADTVTAPSARPETSRPATVQFPDPSAWVAPVTVCSGPASDTLRFTVVLASAVPESVTECAPALFTTGTAPIPGAAGAVVSIVTVRLVAPETLPATSTARNRKTWVPSARA